MLAATAAQLKGPVKKGASSEIDDGAADYPRATVPKERRDCPDQQLVTICEMEGTGCRVSRAARERVDGLDRESHLVPRVEQRLIRRGPHELL